MQQRISQKCDFKAYLLTHSVMKPHVCDVCNKGFSRKDRFNDHLWTHTGEKSHVCEICKKKVCTEIRVKETYSDTYRY